MASERIQRRIEILLEEADEAVGKSDWAVVRDRAQNVLRLDPENSDAISYQAAADRDQGLPSVVLESAKTAATEAPSPSALTPDAELRQLTVMFCDLQDSTALSQKLDPVDLRNVIRSYQEVCAGAVSRFD